MRPATFCTNALDAPQILAGQHMRSNPEENANRKGPDWACPLLYGEVHFRNKSITDDEGDSGGVGEKNIRAC